MKSAIVTSSLKMIEATDIEFFRDSDDYGYCFDARCPVCKCAIRVCQFGIGECDCGYAWQIAISIYAIVRE